MEKERGLGGLYSTMSDIGQKVDMGSVVHEASDIEHRFVWLGLTETCNWLQEMWDE